AFDWHTRPGALERLSPPWESARLLRSDGIHDGDVAELRVGVGPVEQRWVARHRDFVDGVQFADEQVEGPFARWLHTHRFEPAGDSACTMIDHVEYALPLGGLGRAVAGGFVRRKLERMFEYRHATLASDLARHRSAPRAPLTVAVSGASGLIGRQLCAFLSTGGHRVVRLVRRTARGADEIAWDPAEGTIDGARLEGVDAVVHLAGANVGEGRWTAARKRELVDSRVLSTSLLARTLAACSKKPSVLVSASAIGWYGTRPDVVDERDGPGDDFLGELCVEWEAAAEPARAAGIRVAHPRLGIVLTPAGGALAKMLPPFKLGLGATLGDGAAPFSWVAPDDVLGALHFALFRPDFDGPFNVTAPSPTTQGELAAALGRALGHPPLLRLPGAALRLAVGEMAESVLGSARVLPSRLLAAGFRFGQPTLAGALDHVLGVHSSREAPDPRPINDDGPGVQQ
ncbi:MAG: TIGR01777 family oxidoreductase, partial [Polyangia bacterium]